MARWWRWIWRSSLGRYGEKLAVAELKRQGFRIAKTNLKTPIGEIDILAEKPGEWAVVEVRTRTVSPTVGITPEATVDADKRAKLTRVAHEWWCRRGRPPVAIMFHVIGITVDDNWNVLELRHVPRAFEPPPNLRYLR